MKLLKSGICRPRRPQSKDEKREQRQDFVNELNKLWNIKVTVIPTVIGVLRTVTRRLVKGLEDWEIRGRVETIQTTTLLRLARILRRVVET